MNGRNKTNKDQTYAGLYHQPKNFHQTEPTVAQIKMFSTEAINPIVLLESFLLKGREN